MNIAKATIPETWLGIIGLKQVSEKQHIMTTLAFLALLLRQFY